MNKKFLLIAFAFCVVSNSVLAQKDHWLNTGMGLLKTCKTGIEITETRQMPSDENDLSFSFYCFGMVRGIMDMNTYYIALNNKLPDGEKFPAYFCPPENASVHQIMMVILKYLEEHPSELHKQASVLAIDALIDAYACG